MVAPSKLKKGDIIKALTAFPKEKIYVGDRLTVKATGYNHLSGLSWATAVNSSGFKITILHNYDGFELEK